MKSDMPRSVSQHRFLWLFLLLVHQRHGYCLLTFHSEAHFRLGQPLQQMKEWDYQLHDHYLFVPLQIKFQCNVFILHVLHIFQLIKPPKTPFHAIGEIGFFLSSFKANFSEQFKQCYIIPTKSGVSFNLRQIRLLI